MAAFLVFPELPGLTRDQYSAAQRAAADAIGQAAGSRRVRYHGGFFLPGRARDLCLRRGSAADLTAVNQQAGMPFTEVVEAIGLRPRRASA